MAAFGDEVQTQLQWEGTYMTAGGFACAKGPIRSLTTTPTGRDGPSTVPNP